MKKLLVLAILSIAMHSYAQQKVQKYDITSLFSQNNAPYFDVGFFSPSASKHEEIERGNLSDIIKNIVAPGNWDNYEIREEGNLLYVDHSKKVCHQVKRLLLNLQQALNQELTINIQLYELANNQFAKMLHLPPKKLINNFISHKSAKQISYHRFTGQKGQISQLANNMGKLWYVFDKDVEIAEGSTIGDPISVEIFEGQVYRFTATPTPDGKHVFWEGGLRFAKAKRPLRTFASKDRMAVELPSITLQGSMGGYFVPVAKKSILGLFSTSDNKIRMLVGEVELKDPMSENIINIQPLLKAAKNYKSNDYISLMDVNNKKNLKNIGMGVFAEKKSLFDQIKEEIPQKNIFRHFLLVKPSLAQAVKSNITQIFKQHLKTFSVRFSCYLINKESHQAFLQKFSKTKSLSQEDCHWLATHSEHTAYAQTSACLGQKATTYSLLSHNFVQDFDVEVAKNAYIPDPVIGTISEGIRVDVQPLSLEANNISIRLKSSVLRLKQLRQVSISPREKLEQPDCNIFLANNQFKVPLGTNYLHSFSMQEGKIVVFTIKVDE